MNISSEFFAYRYAKSLNFLHIEHLRYSEYLKEICKKFDMQKIQNTFTKLLPNLETMSIYWNHIFKESIALTSLLVSNLLESVQTHSKIKKIDIVNPKGDISEFVMENKEQFECIGWTLSKRTFRSSLHQRYGEFKSNLCIERE